MTLPASPTLAETTRFIVGWLDHYLATQRLAGISVALIADQQVAWSSGTGWQQRAPFKAATDRTLYRIASISKLFTATAVMQLRDRGLLELDVSLEKYLPQFRIQNPFPHDASITLRQLLTHTSGLPRESAFPYWTEDQFPSQQEMWAALPQQSRVLPTLTQWKYSNLAVALAGEVIERVSGLSYADYLHQFILSPLGMPSTWVGLPPGDHPDRAQGLARRLAGSLDEPGLEPMVALGGLAAAGDLTSNVLDLARFAMLQLRRGPAGGEQILAGSTLAEMHRVHWLDPSWQFGWGLGFHLARKNGQTWLGHNGAVPGFRSALWLIPEEKIGAVVLANADQALPLMVAEKILGWAAPVLRSLMSPPAAHLPVTNKEAYLGRYRNRWSDLEVIAWQGKLLMVDYAEVDPLAMAVQLVPLGGAVFRMETPSGSQNRGELLEFEYDMAGQVVGIVYGQSRDRAMRLPD
jgi:CubicO group peptidase (beta-lactamase class C family)